MLGSGLPTVLGSGLRPRVDDVTVWWGREVGTSGESTCPPIYMRTSKYRPDEYSLGGGYEDDDY